MATNNTLNNELSYLQLPQNGFAPSPVTGGVLAVSAGDRLYYNDATATYGLPLLTNGGGGLSEGDLLLGNAAGYCDLLNIGTATYVLTSDGTTAAWAAAGGGTVTSIGLAQGATDFTISGSPVTAAGDITITLNTVGIDKGGTGQTTKAPAFDALSPTTTSGDISYRGDTANIRLATGTVGQVLKVVDATPGAVVLGWATPTVGTVTSVTLTSPNTNAILSGTNPITSSGTIDIDVGAPVFWNAARTQFSIGPKNIPANNGNIDIYLINTIGIPSATVGVATALVGIGRNALGAITSGSENVALGCGTLAALTTGFSNVAIGNGAMYDAITSHDNTAIGHNSLQGDAATSFNSSALGINAGSASGMTSFNNNTFLGANTAIGGASVTPSYRTAIGSGALVGDDNLVQLGLAEAIGIGLYGSAAPAALDAAGSGYIALAVINPSGSIYKLATTGMTGIVGLSGVLPIATTGGSDATVGQATIAAATTVITVNTTQALTGSNIFATMAGFTGTATLALGPVGVGNIVNGTSFDITIATVVPAVSTALVNWFIINP